MTLRMTFRRRRVDYRANASCVLADCEPHSIDFADRAAFHASDTMRVKK
jgi:hypothetical protein